MKTNKIIATVALASALSLGSCSVSPSKDEQQAPVSNSVSNVENGGMSETPTNAQSNGNTPSNEIPEGSVLVTPPGTSTSETQGSMNTTSGSTEAPTQEVTQPISTEYKRPNGSTAKLEGKVILEGKAIKKVIIESITGTPPEQLKKFEDGLNTVSLNQSIDAYAIDAVSGQSLSSDAFEKAIKGLKM